MKDKYINGFKIPKYVNWSATSWKRWRTCPKWFYKANVEYVPVPVGRKETLVGSVVHEVNEDAFKQRACTRDFYIKAVDEKFNEIIERENINFDSYKEADEFLKKCLLAAEQFYTALETHDLLDYDAKLETSFSIKLSDIAYIKGKSDYFRKVGERYQLIDFKNTVHTKYLDNAQLAIYAFSHAKELNIKVDSIDAAFLSIPLNKLIPVRVSQSVIRDLLIDMDAATSRIQRGLFPASANAVSCKLCPYKDSCADFLEFDSKPISTFKEAPKFIENKSFDLFNF